MAKYNITQIQKMVDRLVKIFKEFYGIKLDIKKPNDIMIKDKKVGGILTESKVSSEIVKFLVIGIGINTEKAILNMEFEDLEKMPSYTKTDIKTLITLRKAIRKNKKALVLFLGEETK